MLEVIIQTSEISNQGYIFITSNTNNSDIVYLSELFSSINSSDKIENEIVFKDNRVYLSQTGIQDETQRKCETVLVVNNVDISKLSEKDKTILSNYLTKLLAEIFPNIIKETQNNTVISNRQLTCKSNLLTSFEKELNSYCIPSISNKSEGGKIGCGRFFLIVFVILVLGSIFSKFNSSNDSQNTNTVISIFDEVGKKYNTNKSLLDKWKKASLNTNQITEKNLQDRFKNDLNNGKWPFIFCKNNYQTIIDFFNITGQNSRPEFIFHCREWILKTHKSIENIFSLMRKNHLDTRKIGKMLDTHKDIDCLFNWMESINNLSITKSKTTQTESPIFTDDDIKYLSDIKKLISVKDYSIANVLLENMRSNFMSIKDNSNIKTIADCLTSGNLRENLGFIKESLNIAKRQFSETQTECAVLEEVLKNIIAFSDCFNNIPQSEE